MRTVPYVPHTDQDVRHMLDEIGAASTDELFEDIPSSIRAYDASEIPSGLSEQETLWEFERLAGRNSLRTSFLGAGAYDHVIPSTVAYVTSRTEFATAYTPYQAEIAQGVLQAIFEYQTYICELTGLSVSNASLYDGHTAAAEACAMAVNATRRRNRILYAASVHPFTVQVVKTFFADLDIDVEAFGAFDEAVSADKLRDSLDEHVAGVLVQTPSFMGVIEDLSGVADAVHDCGAKLVVSANPVSLGVLRSPAEWGADIAVGDCQPCGLAQNFGGPSVGYIAATEKLMRKMPGRIVGQSVDTDGKRAFVLTLQAREQHIKRERATSNICTNQALAALAVSVFLSTVGPTGFRDLGERNLRGAHYMRKRLEQELSIRTIVDAPVFNEFCVRLPLPARTVVDRLQEYGYWAGVPLGGVLHGSDRDLLIAVTEKRTRSDIDGYVNALREVIHG